MLGCCREENASLAALSVTRSKSARAVALPPATGDLFWTTPTQHPHLSSPHHTLQPPKGPERQIGAGVRQLALCKTCEQSSRVEWKCVQCQRMQVGCPGKVEKGEDLAKSSRPTHPPPCNPCSAIWCPPNLLMEPEEELHLARGAPPPWQRASPPRAFFCQRTHTSVAVSKCIS